MNKHAQVAPFAIANITIRQDDQGRYSLNDLHKAAGKLPKHQPSNWLANQQTKDLIAEFDKGSHGIPGLHTIKGTRSPGTYVVKELVYAYATWISSKFHLQVIRAYDALQSKPASNTEPLPMPELPHRYRILTTIDRGHEPVQQVIPEHSCIVNPHDPVAVETFIREFVPSNPQMLAAVSSAYITKILNCQDAAAERMQSSRSKK